MKSIALSFFGSLLLVTVLHLPAFTQTITLSTVSIPAANLTQASSNNVIYITKMDVAALPVIVNSIQFTLSGTYDDDDLGTVKLFFNPSAPSLAGSNIIFNTSGAFVAPHSFDISFSNQNVSAGTTGYFILTANINATATNAHTIQLNGALNPVSFGYTTAATVTNNQTDVAGIQTIIAATVTLGSITLPVTNIAQGSGSNVIYITKVDVADAGVTINNIQFRLSGTYDNDDLGNIKLFFNPSAPSLAGSGIIFNTSGAFAAPHSYDINFSNVNMTAGSTGYFILTADVNAAATNGNTIKLDGAADPVSLGYTNTTDVINNQADVAGIQTILAAGVTLSSFPVAASNIIQGSAGNIVYITKAGVASSAVTVNNIQFNLSGTYDDNDISNLKLYFNSSDPSIAGAFIVFTTAGTFVAPHNYNINFSNVNIAAGESGYFILTADLDATASIGNIIKLNGATDPVIFGYTTSPPVTNNQLDVAGIQTISGPIPLSLTSFTGNLIDKQTVELQWTTTEEINTESFEIEWSIDGRYFNSIALLPATGNSSQTQQYNYLHSDPIDGNNYYRLKMTDKDGSFYYSQVIKLKVAAYAEINVFPNPVIDYLQLHIRSLKNESIIVRLCNADGKLITLKTFNLVKGNNRLSWNMQQFPPGNYFISSSDKQFETIKIIKH